MSYFTYTAASILILHIVLPSCVNCFSQFAPTFACDHMTPGHQGTSPQNNQGTPFSLQPLSNTYTPGGENIKIRLSVSGVTFRGILLQARPVNDIGATGTWNATNINGIQTTFCTHRHGGLTHKGNADKLSDIDFTWTPPSENKGDVQFIMTIVEKYETYYTFIRSPIISYHTKKSTTTSTTTTSTTPSTSSTSSTTPSTSSTSSTTPSTSSTSSTTPSTTASSTVHSTLSMTTESSTVSYTTKTPTETTTCVCTTMPVSSSTMSSSMLYTTSSTLSNSSTTSTYTSSTPSTSTSTTSSSTSPTTSPTTSSSTSPSTTSTTSFTTTTKNEEKKIMIECNFEKQDWCGIEQDKTDDFDWTLLEGATPSQITGPSSAFSGSSYIYIETSTPRKREDKATILLPVSDRSGPVCIQFAYHMFGFHINTLEMFKQHGSSRKPIWSESKEFGNVWREAKALSSLLKGERLGFTGIRGDGYSGDIAIDNLKVTFTDTC